MSNDRPEKLEARINALESELHQTDFHRGRRPIASRGVRKRSKRTICGLPLYDIAIGPDFEKGEMRGHARGLIAIGEIATGILAIGGIARGFIVIGGVAIGAASLGGVAIGIGLAIGGAAIGAIAFGGGAGGFAAMGGEAVGYYACGGDAHGVHVVSPMIQDPQAVKFFTDWVPCFDQIFPVPPLAVPPLRGK
jgi:hypothetical protein